LVCLLLHLDDNSKTVVKVCCFYVFILFWTFDSLLNG
jgi:hypothetical protein